MMLFGSPENRRDARNRYRRWVPALFLCLLFAGSAGDGFAAPPAGYYEVWGDEFNGTSLDTTKWDYWLLGNRRDAVNVTNAVAVSGGYLTITTYTTNNTHYTAMVATDGTFRSRYGYWEASIKWGDTNGMWSAYWMQSPTMGTYLNDPAVSGSELDFVEHRSTDGGSNGDIINQVQNNIHWNGYGSFAASAGSGNIGSGLGSGFHTYGFLWTPSAYTLYVDGANLRSWNFSNNGVPISESTEWTILSSEVDDTSTTWAGAIPAGGYGNLGTSTTKLMVDYVRYYAPTNTVFWTGASSLDLTDSANFVSNMPPLATSDLTFSYLSGNNLSPVLGGNLSVDGLVFLNLNNGATLSGTNVLTLGAGGLDMVAANHSVTISCPVNLGANQTWAIGPNSPGNTLNVNSSLSGTVTLSKGGYGTVILNGTNSFSGTLNVDTGSTSANDGALEITRNQNLANVLSPISIRNNNSGSSTLQLNGSAGNLTIAQGISLAGRNTNVVALQNLSGSNTISGNFILASGGSVYWLDSDSGTLNLAGMIPASAPSVPSARTLTFMGAGSIVVSGSISNANGFAVSVLKTNSGTLTFSGTNTYSGTTVVAGGVLQLARGVIGTNSVTVTSGRLGGAGVINGPVTIQGGGVFAPGSNVIAAFTINNSLNLAGITLLKLNKTAGTNDSVLGLTSIVYGGTLTVTNLGGTLAAGDSFKIFQAQNQNGSFTALNLPPLGTGLAWDTNALASGMLAVVATAPPQFDSITQNPGGNIQFHGSGSAGVTYELDAATNLLPPIPWFFVTNTVADQNGLFQLWDLQATNFPLRFYRISGSQ